LITIAKKNTNEYFGSVFDLVEMGNNTRGIKMSKWADYLISAIRFEDDKIKNIAYLKVHPDCGEEVGAGSTWTREEVLNAMYDGKTFYTILKSNTGEWKKGAHVALVTKNGRSIITDLEHTDMDFLSDLQEL
jgi:hypothetical protein